MGKDVWIASSFFFSFSLPTTNTQLGLFSPGTSLPLVFQQTSPHTLSHTHTHHSTAILEKRLFVYDPFKKKKKKNCEILLQIWKKNVAYVASWGVVWIFRGEGNVAETGIGRYMSNFLFCSYFPPPPHFFFDSPLFYSFSHPPPSLPQSPSPAGCLILSRFQHAFSLLEELQVCWWNLAEKGCESRQRLLT